ncbi:50S ribosomal protein L24 [Galenea microaerophila]
MNRLIKGDLVVVIAGKDKGKQGTIAKVLKNGKVVVDGINLAKKHVKANPMTGEAGGIVEKEMPIDASNVALLNPETKKAEKVSFKEVDGKKVRVFRKSGKPVSA